MYVNPSPSTAGVARVEKIQYHKQRCATGAKFHSEWSHPSVMLCQHLTPYQCHPYFLSFFFSGHTPPPPLHTPCHALHCHAPSHHRTRDCDGEGIFLWSVRRPAPRYCQLPCHTVTLWLPLARWWLDGCYVLCLHTVIVVA